MPQIVNAEAGDTGGLGELAPIALDIDTVTVGPMAGKDVLTQRALRMLGGVRVADFATATAAPVLTGALHEAYFV